MGTGKTFFFTIFWGSIVSSNCVYADSASTASASARITLHLPPKVEVYKSKISNNNELCMARIPAYTYKIEISDLDGGNLDRFDGVRGSGCIPKRIKSGFKYVTVVAE